MKFKGVFIESLKEGGFMKLKFLKEGEFQGNP